jgi:hypothetical protein
MLKRNKFRKKNNTAFDGPESTKIKTYSKNARKKVKNTLKVYVETEDDSVIDDGLEDVC